jgi:O-antigen polymerase
LFQHGLKQGRLDRILFVIVISALLQGLVGIAQIWLQADMPFWLPKSPNGVPSGLFQQINNQATYQVTAIMIVAYLITRPFISFAKPWLKSLLILAVLCASFLVAVSGSRIGALTLILGMLIIIPNQWQRFKQRKKIALIAFAALVMGLGVGSVVGNSHAIDKTVAMQSGYSGESRIGIYTIALDLIKQQPVFGHGVGSFGREFQYAKPDFYAEHPDAVLPNQFVSHPHNEVFFWLVEGGLIAGVGLLAVLIGVILALKKLGWQRGGAYAAMLLPIGLHTQVELPFNGSTIHWLVFIFILIIIMICNPTVKKLGLTISARRLSTSVLTLIILIGFVFFAHTLRSQHDFTEFYQKLNLDKPAFPYALKNPYLGEEARWLQMSEFLFLSMNEGLKNNVKQYTLWGEQRLLEKPTVELYEKLVDAYQFLGNKVAYCATSEYGLASYPQAERLKLAKDSC